MGQCVGKKETKKIGDFNWKQQHLLSRMFDDLACRSINETITKDIFKSFFNLNGLWGEEIFRKFDNHNIGQLDFNSFLAGLGMFFCNLAMLVKGSHQKQIYSLFQFYDVSKEDGIRYNQLLKMFYSYSKEQLINLVSDDKFLNTMKEPERKYIFGKDEQLDPLRQVIQQSSSEDDQDEIKTLKNGNAYRRMTDAGRFIIRRTTSQQVLGQSFETNETKQKQLFDLSKFANKGKQKEANKQNKLIIDQIGKNKPQTKRRGTVNYIQLKKTQIKTIPTISLLAKKYACYLFNQFKLDKDKDSLTFKQFQQLVSRHEKLLSSYFGGFHQYIWEVAENQVPDYLKMTCWNEGPCTIKDIKNNTTSKRYLRFYKTTLFVTRNKQDTLPESIVNLEGLLVSKYDDSKQYGFLIQHRDGLYPEKAYLFLSVALQQQWLIHCSGFMHNSVHDDYNMLDRIGSGNYSTVFKGVSKKSKADVAIKVIQKFKFSIAQKQIIKQQCGILELALHPSIVSFIQKVETKTHLYLVTEFMGDGDLLDYVKRKRFLQEYEAATIMTQLFSALEYLNNSLAIIHRDLKCQNIMIKLKKQKDCIEKVKIIDFGFAVYKDVLQKLPAKEKYVGTPNYVAPQILKNENFNEKVDMFSLGVIMFYILSGQLPFDSPFMQDISKSTVDCSFCVEGMVWNSVSPQAKDLIKKILCDQEKRITVSQALKHPWLKNKEDLKENTRSKLPKYL